MATTLYYDTDLNDAAWAWLAPYPLKKKLNHHP